VTLEPVNVVGESANVIWVMSPGPRGEHVHKFEMFAIPKCLVIKPTILGLIARQPALPWQAVCTQTVASWLKCTQA